ncbi:MAG: hypothetical protein ACFFD1_07640 [Candidatus Thorarchaeota archaeon]
MFYSIIGSGKRYTALVAPGSTQLHYTKDHPLIQLLIPHCWRIFSLELPGHSISNETQREHLSIEFALNKIKNDLNEIKYKIKGRILLIGYSIGGLFFLKILNEIYKEFPDFQAIFIGCGLKMTEMQNKVVERFFSVNFYKKLGWENLMINQHGPNWEKLVEKISEWLRPNSELFLTVNEIDFLLKHEKKIFFILAKRDQPFSESDINLNNEIQFTLKIVKGDHFSYFSPRVALPEITDIISIILT